MRSEKKSAIIAFLGNAYHDSRVVNLIDSLGQLNINVKTISFDWKTPGFKTLAGDTSVYKLKKSGSSLSYYFNFLFILVRFLLKNKADFYFAEDVQTLPAVYFFAKLSKGRIFYNSREIYAHLGGLRNKNFVQSIIARIENTFIRNVDLVLVTGEMDAKYLANAYAINNIFVLRNLPKFKENIEKIDLHSKLNIPGDHKIILYQGVLLEGRGISKIISLLGEITDVHFVILGEGEFKSKFEKEAAVTAYSERIHFMGVVPHSELLNYTASADLGLALIENISISYFYALPNKLFEYIMAGIPILASNLPQMKMIIDNYGVGKYVDPENEKEIINALKEMLGDEGELQMYKSNCINAAKELNWEKEFSKFHKYLNNK